MTPTEVVATAVAFGTVLTVAVATSPAAGTSGDEVLVRPARPEAVRVAAQGRGRGNQTAALYEEHCASCHGSDLGVARARNLFDQRWLNRVSDPQIIARIAEGVPDTEMGSFEQMLTEDEMWDLVRYIRGQADTLRPREAFVPDFDGEVVESEKQAFRLEVVAGGLDTPWGLDFLPDGRMIVSERSGAIRLIADGQVSAPIPGTPEVHVQQDGGMLDLIVHPDYEQNGWIYLGYTEALRGWEPPPPAAAAAEPQGRGRGNANRPPSMTVIARGRLNANDEWVDTEVLFRGADDLYTTSGAHYGLRFIFDDEGHLFYAIGERGDMTNAQVLTNPLGKIHRINDDGTIPEDNPFVGQPGAVASIWAYGNRNPQGFAWDPATGLLWESEHGPGGGDEINIIERGDNYGWGVASMGSQGGITKRTEPGMVDPIVYYNPTLAPSGIAFYTGDRYPAWQGDLFVTGLRGEQVRRLEVSGRTVTHQEVLFEKYGRMRDIAMGPDGYLYVVQQNPTGGSTGLRLSDPSPGAVLRLVPVE